MNEYHAGKIEYTERPQPCNVISSMTNVSPKVLNDASSYDPSLTGEGGGCKDYVMVGYVRAGLQCRGL